MEECFGREITRFPAASFYEVMEAVHEGKADFGVLPIENTTTGGITDSYDLLVEFDNYIVAEHILRINQALLGLPGAAPDEIRTVYSHAQGILQSRKFLENYPKMQAIESGSTAEAARRVAQEGDPTKAAIASVRAAEKYGLSVLAEQINSEDCNSTRFIIITNRKEYLATANKVSPLSGKNFEYRFFVDFEGNLTEAAVQNTLACIRIEALEMKILGNYRTI